MDIKRQQVRDGFGGKVEHAKLNWSAPDISKLEFPATAANVIRQSRFDNVLSYNPGFS